MVLKSRKPCTGYFSKISITVLMVVCMPNLLRTAPLIFFPQPFLGWSTFGKVEIKNDGPFENNPNYVRLSYSGHSDKHTGLENEGFFGIAVKQNNEYRFSVTEPKSE